jgi:hypothetical protein
MFLSDAGELLILPNTRHLSMFDGVICRINVDDLDSNAIGV